MTNPFVVAGRMSRDFSPLRPWLHTEHHTYYAPVDHTLEAFENFVGVVTGAVAGATPITCVIVTGPEGCGKTSLVHRCAAALTPEELGVSSLDIIDLSDEYITGVSADARLSHVCDRLIDVLSIKAILPNEAQQKLEQK